MSRYRWPQQPPDTHDDAAGRARFVAARRTQLDLDAALSAGRRLAPPTGRRRRAGVAFAPPDTRTDLWIPLGPATVIGGDAAGKPRVTGRVRALFVHPAGQRIYAATANGGVWYSSDGGESWRSIGGFAPTDTPGIVRPAHRQACGAILTELNQADPDDESLDRVFVGTGELTPELLANPGKRYGGIGILFAVGPATSLLPDPWVEEAPNLQGAGVYRFALSPDGNTVVAATSVGLVQRPPGGGAGVAWDKVAGSPFDTFGGVVTDVLWTRAVAGGPPARLWVWARGDQAGLWVRDDGETDFRHIDTLGSMPLRGSLAAADPPTKVFVFNDRGDVTLPVLYRVTTDSADPPTAELVVGVPDMLARQGFYDLAIRVDPANADRVILGGSLFRQPPHNPAVAGQNVNVTGDLYPEDAAIFSAEVGDEFGVPTYGHPDPPRRIGVGCHADVHDLHFSDGGGLLWAATDGGVFRSIFPEESVGFVARNNGLGVVEANYVASHPSCEGFVVVGLQDNGIIERVSSAVWTQAAGADGGSVAFDPLDPSRYVHQVYQGRWRGSDGAPFDRLLHLRGAGGIVTPLARHEFEEDSAFYSTVSAIAHVHAIGAVPHSQVLIGTTRVWYSRDWGLSFVTLPTGGDPITALAYDKFQDRFGEPVIVCKWATPDDAWILGARRLERYVRVFGSDVMAGPGVWDHDPILVHAAPGKNKKNAPSELGPIGEAVVWTDVEPNLDAPGVIHGPKGAVYLGTVGKEDDAAVDTLWWFDGTDTWHPTGLRAVVSAPVTAVRCDPLSPDDVYVGTTVGVWHGLRALIPAPAWQWRALVNGLPEAVVQDLSLFDNGGVRLLRAAIASRGVWELRLGADVQDLTYVRAHADDLRYRDRAIETQRDGTTPRSWHSSPDVRPRVTPVALPAPAAPLRLDAPGATETLRRFQAAMRSRFGDDRIRATGVWDLYFEDLLREWGAPADPADGRMQIDEAFWNAVVIPPHDIAEPWATVAEPDRVPTEADLLELTPRIPEGDADSVSMTVHNVLHKVDVVVHHRGLEPRVGADVRVTLLRWIRTQTDPIPRRHDPGTWFTRDIPWAAAVNDVLNSPDGTTSQAFGDGWEFVGNAADRRKSLTGQEMDNTRSAVATFDLNLTDFVGGTVMLLAAVIRAGGDSAVVTDKLRNLALEDPHVAVRSLVIEKP
jgi:hypothetical protein